MDLSLNLLETLSAETLRWEMLDYLDLSGNPWVCNCSLLSFLPGVLRRIKRSGNRAVCVQPEQMLGVELSNAVSLFYCAFHNYGNKRGFDMPSSSIRSKACATYSHLS